MNKKMSDELINLFKEGLIEGLQKRTSLNSVCEALKHKIRNRGQWLCLIEPFGVETGFVFYSYKAIYFDFKANGLMYRVTIAQTE